MCQILPAIQTSRDRYARQASVCSPKKYAMKGVRAFCLKLVLHSFQMVFLSCNYVKSHIDRNQLAHVIESHSSLAIPEMCVGFKIYGRASLVTQWLRIHLPTQGKRVRALVQEDPTCRGATKPVRHNY